MKQPIVSLRPDVRGAPPYSTGRESRCKPCLTILRPANPSMIFSQGSRPLRESRSSPSWRKPRPEWLTRLREGSARRMRRLAPDSRYHRPRRQDRSSNGLDDGQEWGTVDACGWTVRCIRHRGSKSIFPAELGFLSGRRNRASRENEPPRRSQATCAKAYSGVSIGAARRRRIH